jgi:hypothetical protein
MVENFKNHVILIVTLLRKKKNQFRNAYSFYLNGETMGDIYLSLHFYKIFYVF